jgi:hypothetical protein
MGNTVLLDRGLNPNNYSLRLYIDKNNYIAANILFDPKYNQVSPYKQIVKGTLEYISDMFSQLNKDSLAIIIAKLDSQTVNNYCISSRRLLKLCQDEDFWHRVCVIKYGKDVSLQSDRYQYPSWKSFFFDTDPTSQLTIAVNGCRNRNINMTPYTPYFKFLERLGINNGTIILYKSPTYNFLDIQSLPKSNSVLTNKNKIRNVICVNFYESKLAMADTLDYFNNEDRYNETGKLQKGKYHYRFILLKPYITFSNDTKSHRYGNEREIILGLCLIGIEFKLGKLEKGWTQEPHALPLDPDADYNIFPFEIYQRILKYIH